MKSKRCKACRRPTLTRWCVDGELVTLDAGPTNQATATHYMTRQSELIRVDVWHTPTAVDTPMIRHVCGAPPTVTTTEAGMLW